MALNKLKKFLDMIDFSFTLFALPFTYLGAFLAARGIPAVSRLIWITTAMVSARTAALCLNRLIDRKIDRTNPRTSNWVMASGQLQAGPVWAIVLACWAVLFYSAAQLNSLCVKLAPLAVMILWGYSYTKHFTWWCHLILGLADGAGTVGAWIAITGNFDWQPLILGMAVACWVAGFDTMYACQDIDFDRRYHLFSIPARFGETGALKFSAVFHLGTAVFLLLTGMILRLGVWYYLGVAITAVILAYEHIIVKPGNLHRVNFASFKINQYVGLIIFALALVDIL